MPQDKSLVNEGDADVCATGDEVVASKNWLLLHIPRWRWAFFAVVALLLILSFNGQWRVGRDSAAYRGLAHQLATTGKYVFRENGAAEGFADQGDTRYPGMPVLLAGIEKAFGPGDLPAVGVVMLMGIAVLLLTTVWVKKALPAWVAIAVIFGMGTNGRFLEHCNEILSDVPFLLGVVGILVVFERLTHAQNWLRRSGWMAALMGCLVFLAVMRPTFWVIGAAIAATCLVGLFRPIRRDEKPGEPRQRRLACALTLAILVVAAGVFVLGLDLRGKKAGTYEKWLDGVRTDFRERVMVRLPQNLNELLEQSLPESFFGTQMGPGFIRVGHEVGKESRAGKPLKWGMSSVLSLLLIASGVSLARRNMLWGMIVLATICTMILVGSVPRYFVMVLPLLLAGWGLMINRLAARAAGWGKGAGEAVVFIGLGLVVAPNLLHAADLIREQHGLTRPQQGMKNVGFLKAYHGGQWAEAYDIAKLVRENVKPGERVIGPQSTVLTYLSGRDVYGLGMLLPRKDTKGIWERATRRMSKANTAVNGFYFTYALFPETTVQSYDDKDQLTGKLIRMGMLKPVTVIARGGGYVLATYEVVHLEKKRGRGLRGKDIAKMNAVPGSAVKPGKRTASPSTKTAPTTKTAPGTTPATTQPVRPRGAPGRGLRGKDVAKPASPTLSPAPSN